VDAVLYLTQPHMETLKGRFSGNQAWIARSILVRATKLMVANMQYA